MESIWSFLGQAWRWVWDNIFYINIILAVFIVFFQRRDPKAVWTWLLALYFLPIVGFIFYLLICQDYRKQKMFRIKDVEDTLNRMLSQQEDELVRRKTYIQDTVLQEYVDLALYNLEANGAVYTRGNDIQVFTDGVAKFEDLKEEIKKAEKYIHMEYYIIQNDSLFDEISGLLMEKAREGVEVRLLYDAMGCRMMPPWVMHRLKRAGVKVAVFFPAILKWFQVRVNYRNHRKIVVIDGRVGYVGGFNIGEEYISKSKKFGYWRDTHLKMWGPSVMGLQLRFVLDWNFAAKDNLFRDAKYFREEENDRHGDKGVQIVASGPDSRSQEIRDNYLRLIHKAKDHVYIQTPYFVPDEAILSALIIAAKSGVDVRLMIPCKPDHPFVYWASYSYIWDLLEAGAKCYTYQNGFLHSKLVTADGLVACCGTANMDIRSFQLNFEVNAVIFDRDTTEELERAFLKDIERSKEITRELYAQRSLVVRMKEQVSRLLSPLL